METRRILRRVTVVILLWSLLWCQQGIKCPKGPITRTVVIQCPSVVGFLMPVCKKWKPSGEGSGACRKDSWQSGGRKGTRGGIAWTAGGRSLVLLFTWDSGEWGCRTELQNNLGDWTWFSPYLVVIYWWQTQKSWSIELKIKGVLVWRGWYHTWCNSNRRRWENGSRGGDI